MITFIVCLLAGLGAGLGTGFAGMSAAAVISPMLIAFLHMDAYQAIGIALASDVLASAVSAYTYGKNKNLDIKNGLVMMFTVMIFTFVASYLASFIPSTTMGGFSTFMTMLLGIKFIVKPVMTTKETMAATDPKKRIIQSIICGTVIGCICGFVGAGGGMMMLLILTSVLGYELKTAVGTSVFIMTFTALTGALSHFAIGGTPDLVVLILCIVSTLIFARVAAVLANKAPAKLLNQAVLRSLLCSMFSKITAKCQPGQYWDWHFLFHIKLCLIALNKLFIHQINIMRCVMSVCFHFLRCELTHYFCRVAKCHGIVRDYHFSSDKCAGSNDAVLSDHCAAQYNASHSHNGIISNRTAVHYRIVSDGHTFSDMDGMSLICMQCAVILHIGIVVNKNTSRIATHHCVIPDSYILS